MYQPVTITKNEMRDDGDFLVYGANGVIGRYDKFNHEDPQLIIGCRGACGTVHVTEPKSWITGNSMVIKPVNPMVDISYLRYFFMQPEVLASVITGAAQPQITRKSLLPVKVPVPPLDEQKRIVAILDQAFAALDRARANAEANLADAADLFGSVLSEAFESHPDWPEKFLPDISENLDRQRVPITKKDRKPGCVPYYGASGVVDHVARHIFDEDLLLVSEDGANLLARTYPIAFSISGKSWVNNHAHVLRFADPVTQEYVRLYLNSISLVPYVSGMAQPKLNQKSLNSIPIPFPDEATRVSIVSKANAVREHHDALADNYKTQLSDIAALRQSLLQQAFSGQLT